MGSFAYLYRCIPYKCFSYVVAVHSRRNATLNILPAAKCPYVLTRTVKALKSISRAQAPSALEFKEARTVLGETFGTKKAKANLRAQERNHVDVSAMEGVIGFVMDGIDKVVTGLPTKGMFSCGSLYSLLSNLQIDEAKEAANINRLIPEYDAAATTPDRIYPLHNIVPRAEWKVLPADSFEGTENDKDRKGLLYFEWSSWLNGHLHKMKNGSFQTSKDGKKAL